LPRILFFAEAASLAHVARPLQLASSLGAEWEVSFACADGFDVCFEGLDQARIPLSSLNPKTFLNRLAKGKVLYSQSELAGYIAEDLSLIRRLKPDLVVGDFRLSLSVSARISSTPYVAITNAHWSPWADIGPFPLPDIRLTEILGPRLARPLFRLGLPFAFRMHAAPLNALRKKHGLKPLRDLRWVYTDSDLTLYADTPRLVPTRDLPGHHRYIGPILWSPAIPQPSWWEDLPDQPIAYVTLGSTGRADLLPMVLDSLEAAGFVTLVATAGRADIEAVPGRRFVADYLPGELAAERAALVVCNGGSATVYQALSRGRAVLGICSNMDQFLTMRCVEQAGAGLGLRASTTGSERLGAAVHALRDETGYRCAAASIQQDFLAHPSGPMFARAAGALLGLGK
jgi:UDP:flavonoid glycosyltransferase YjiC (YdhE family)